MTVLGSSGNLNQIYLNETPDLEREMTDPYVIERIKDAFDKDKNGIA